MSFKNEKGFILEYITVYAHQQNRVAGWNIHIILDATWLMLVDSGLLTKYWPKAVHTAVYLQNLVPSKRNSNTVPTEL